MTMARGEPLIRQWNVLKALQAHRFGISADELAGRLECTKRTIQRDLNVLQQAGFPISFEARDYGKKFWKLAPHFLEHEELMLSVTEMVALFLSRQLLAPLTGTQFGDGLATAVDKIKALLSPRALGHFEDLDETLMVKSIARQDYSGQDKEITILNQAIADCRALKIRYHSASQDKVLDATFHPYGLVLFGVSLYCIGRFVERDAVWTLKVSRFEGVQMTGETFERPDTFSLEAYLHGTFGVFSPGKLQTIKARFTGWAATNVREQQWHRSQKILKDTKKHVAAQFELTDTTEFKRWILGFGKHATVLSPKALAREIAAELADAHSAYG